MPWLSIAVILYGIAVAGGGIAGFVIPPGSPASLISGGISGLLLVASGIIAKNNPKAGFGLATVIAIALTALFIYRYSATHKAMPAFGVIGLSVIMLILLVVGHFMKSAGAPNP